MGASRAGDREAEQNVQKCASASFRFGRDQRLAARIAAVGRSPGDFIGLPDCDGRAWFVIKTNPACEMRAETSLLRAGFHAYVPVYRKRLYDQRTKQRIYRLTPFISGYAFVLLDATYPDFGMVRDCDGVRGILPMADGRPPLAFPERGIDAMRRMEASCWLQQDMEFRGRRRRWWKGAKVRPQSDPHVITAGAFLGFAAIIMQMEGRGGVRVATHAFGSVEELVLPLDALLPAA